LEGRRRRAKKKSEKNCGKIRNVFREDRATFPIPLKGKTNVEREKKESLEKKDHSEIEE
jgi:hypothetical protein